MTRISLMSFGPKQYNAFYVINHFLHGWVAKSPFKLLHKANCNLFSEFLVLCYVHIPKSNWTKLDFKAKKCIFIGYDSCIKGWRCTDPATKKVVTFWDVVFDEVSTLYSPQNLVFQNESFMMLKKSLNTYLLNRSQKEIMNLKSQEMCQARNILSKESKGR